MPLAALAEAPPYAAHAMGYAGGTLKPSILHAFKLCKLYGKRSPDG